MKFDYIIGNPPYQDETLGDNDAFAPPIYHYFLDAAYDIGTVVVLITPGRFLFKAGRTPQAWNKKMLADPHLKIISYDKDASRLFKGVEIKGGVAISYRDRNRDFGAISVFSPYEEMQSIRDKVGITENAESLADIIHVQSKFDLDALYQAHPHLREIIGSNGKDKRLRNDAFDKIDVFTTQPTSAGDVSIRGLRKLKRETRFINPAFIDDTDGTLKKWKVLVVRVNGVGALGEVLSAPEIAGPNEGYTQTFIGIGAFDTKEEAENALKYIRTKFARIMLGFLKVTQDNNRDTWRLVPLQNFGVTSDIDWSQSIADIDQQLYKKYGFSDRETAFMESHAKEMV